MTNWISVDDRLPEPHEEVLGYVSIFGNCEIAYLCREGGWHLALDEYGEGLSGDNHHPVTHWMPLPAPPEAGHG